MKSTPEQKKAWLAQRGQKRLGSRFIQAVKVDPSPAYGCTKQKKFRRRGLRMIPLN